MVEDEVRSVLLEAVSATVGNRMFPQFLPQHPTLPAITYQRISTRRERGHDGPHGLATPRLLISFWANTYGAAKTLADEGRRALDGYSDDDIAQIAVSGETDDYDPQRNLQRVWFYATVQHREET